MAFSDTESIKYSVFYPDSSKRVVKTLVDHLSAERRQITFLQHPKICEGYSGRFKIDSESLNKMDIYDLIPLNTTDSTSTHFIVLINADLGETECEGYDRLTPLIMLTSLVNLWWIKYMNNKKERISSMDLNKVEEKDWSWLQSATEADLVNAGSLASRLIRKQKKAQASKTTKEKLKDRKETDFNCFYECYINPIPENGFWKAWYPHSQKMLQYMSLKESQGVMITLTRLCEWVNAYQDFETDPQFAQNWLELSYPGSNKKTLTEGLLPDVRKIAVQTLIASNRTI